MVIYRDFVLKDCSPPENILKEKFMQRYRNEGALAVMKDLLQFIYLKAVVGATASEIKVIMFCLNLLKYY